jgi:EmrB/QacA subfamily drug resistance transporter
MDINVKDAPSTGARAGRWWAVGALALALAGIITGLDTTVVVTALPTLSVKLGATTGQLQWVMDAYLVVLSGLLLPAGVLGDRFGRKRLLVIGLLLFGVSSVFASLTSSADGLIALRAVMGVGAAPILVLMYSILPSMFPDNNGRLRAVAITSASTFVGLSLGPLAGGWLLAHFAWGSIFLINPPVIAIALLGVWFLVPESKDARKPRLDWPGAALSVAGVTALVYGIIEQPMYGWSGARVLAGLIGGVVLLTVFAVQQRRARSPLIDLKLFRTPRFSWATVAIAVVMFALGGVMFILTPFLQIVQGNDAQATGIRLLPLMAGLMAGAALSDRLTVRLGGKVMVAGGMLVGAVGALAAELRWHLECFAQQGDDGLVFIGPKGGRLRRSTFRRTWTKVRALIGLPDLHFHDLRHTGNTMAAGQGASLRELMERMGHSSTRAALIYQHATRERDEAIAAGMGKLLKQARRKKAGGGSGTQRARAPKQAS